MTDEAIFPFAVHKLCAPAPKEGEFLLERNFAEVLASAKGVPLDFNGLLDELREWCAALGIKGHGTKASFAGRMGAHEYHGAATRFRDELSILIHAQEGRRRYRVPGLWSDYSWLVIYQEPLTGEWRSWPGASRDSSMMERDRTTEAKAREAFQWVCRRPIISRARLFKGETMVEEFFGRRR